ncbi:unnamed protein product, partial [Allacma fusca]
SFSSIRGDLGQGHFHQFMI